MELVGVPFELSWSDAWPYWDLKSDRETFPAIGVHKGDPYSYVVSANIHRRHLTAEQKRGLITLFLKINPEKSDRQVAAATKVDHKTVAKVRREEEANGEIPHKPRKEASGRKARGRKPKRRTEDDFHADMKVLRAKKTNGANSEHKPEPMPAAKMQAHIALLEVTDETDVNDTPEVRWQTSLGNLAGEAIALQAYWTKTFGDWQKFSAPSDLATLAQQAAAAWLGIASELGRPAMLAPAGMLKIDFVIALFRGDLGVEEQRAFVKAIGLIKLYERATYKERHNLLIKKYKGNRFLTEPDDEQAAESAT
jgi:hypothetical protein